VPGQMHVQQAEVDERRHRLIGQTARAGVPERGLEVERAPRRRRRARSRSRRCWTPSSRASRTSPATCAL
jgi:hypothetical protein